MLYLTEQEASDVLHLTKTQIRALCDAGRIVGAFDVVIRGRKVWRIPENPLITPIKPPKSNLTPYEKVQKYKKGESLVV